MDRYQSDAALMGVLADAARAASLPHFRNGVAADNKAASGFDPVTAADKAAEAAIRALLGEHRPEDGILGEEEDAKPSRSGRTWIVDPIDGTRAFLAGLPSWCILIALVEEAGPVLSVIDQPHIGERFFGSTGAAGRSAHIERGGVRLPLKVRTGRALGEAIGETTDPYLFEGDEAPVFETVRSRARLMRYGLDAYGYAMVAQGGVDFVIESGLKTWDVAALVPVVEGAGGILTDWQGRPAHEGGQVVAAANADLHGELLALLAPAAR
ncbi:inositol monophosphatase family protein [Glycocaulis alkaliphilus]|nr:inositol monophosphatase family protein [Glycocaulis alkaliphilus]